MTQENFTMSIYELWQKWGSKDPSFGAYDRVYIWHADSEVIGLERLANGAFDIEYADGSIDTVIGGDRVVIQTVIWNTTKFGKIPDWVYFWRNR